MQEKDKIIEYNQKFAAIISDLQVDSHYYPSFGTLYQNAIDECEENFDGRFNRCLLNCKR